MAYLIKFDLKGISTFMQSFYNIHKSLQIHYRLFNSELITFACMRTVLSLFGEGMALSSQTIYTLKLNIIDYVPRQWFPY